MKTIDAPKYLIKRLFLIIPGGLQFSKLKRRTLSLESFRSIWQVLLEYSGRSLTDNGQASRHCWHCLDAKNKIRILERTSRFSRIMEVFVHPGSCMAHGHKDARNGNLIRSP